MLRGQGSLVESEVHDGLRRMRRRSLGPTYQLHHNLWAERGSVFLTGTQALVRLLLMQRARDATAGLNTQGFVSGYRGSPLGMVDQAIWKAGSQAHRSRHPLRAGDQRGARGHAGARHAARRVRPRAHRAMACSRCGTARARASTAPAMRIKHGNAYGASPHGGVLVVAGDDHGCVSSSMPHQSDHAVPGLAHADRGAGQRGRVPRVRLVRLGAVALLGQLGRLDRAVGGGGERRHGRPRR